MTSLPSSVRSIITKGLLPKGPVSLAENHHTGSRVEAPRLGVATVAPGLNLVDEKAFNVANKLPREPLLQTKFADDEAMLEQAALFFDAAPDPFVFIGCAPPALYGASVGFAEVQNFVFVGMEDTVESTVVAPAIGCLIYISPVEDNPFFFHWNRYSTLERVQNVMR